MSKVRVFPIKPHSSFVQCRSLEIRLAIKEQKNIFKMNKEVGMLLHKIIMRKSIYRRTGFKCKHVIIANCDFSQLLERNVYITHSVNQYVARA